MIRKLIQFFSRNNMSPTKILTVGWLPSLILLPVVAWMAWNMYSSYTVIATDEFTLQRHIGRIRHLDEVLTMYARLAATSGEEKWEQQYKKVEPILDDCIVEVAMLARNVYERNYAAQTKLAYAQLLEMEGLAFALVRNGRLEEAVDLLFSKRYEEQKRLYSEGIDNLTSSVQKRIEENIRSMQKRIVSIGLLGFLCVLVLFVAWLGIVLVVRLQLRRRRRAEIALKRSELRYRAVVEDQTELVFRFVRSGRLTFVNEAFCRFFNRPRTELLGERFINLVPESEREALQRHIKSLSVDNPVANHEYALLSGTDETRRLHGTDRAVFNDFGELIEYQSVARDITERRLAERRIQEQNEFLCSVIESLAHPLYIINAEDHTIMTANTAARVAIGRYDATCNEIAHEWEHPCSGADRPCPLDEIKKTKAPVTVEHVKHTDDGKPRVIEVHAYPIFGPDGEVHKVVEYWLDITERKEKERIHIKAERLRALADLAGGVAHNFNNILQIILSGAELALNDTYRRPTKYRTHLERVLQSAQNGAETVKRLQEFANIRSERDVGKGTIFDLGETVERAIEMCRPWWKTRPEKEGIPMELEKNIRPGCPVKGQENEMFEVAVNLIKNAVEALPRGGTITVKVGIERNDVVLIVTDNGIGIPPEHLARVLEPFWTTKGVKASGMGLSSCLGIVKRHKGDLAVDSQQGEGSRFTVRLPLAVESAREEGRIAPASGSRPPISLLLVDDSEAVLHMLEEGLRTLGQEVTTALSGEAAVEILENTSFDAIICDLGMPGMNGWDVGRAVFARCGEQGIPKTPFILLTGWGGQLDEQEKIRESGVDLVVEKPVGVVKLLELVRNLVTEERTRAAL